MISSRQIAKRLIDLIEKGSDPKGLAKSLISSDVRELKAMLPNILEHLERYKKIEDRKNKPQLVVPKDQTALVPEDFNGEVNVDDSLLGGAVITSHDALYDSSLKTSIDSLGRVLIQS